MQPRVDIEALTEAEEAVRARVGEAGVDFAAMSVVSNVYRAATAIRNLIERELLTEHDLTWAGFTTLFVLWVWGPSDSKQLAANVGVSKPTLTGLVRTLQQRDWVVRSVPERDRRRAVISLTEAGIETIERVFPRFHAYEVALTEALSETDRSQVAKSLRRVIEAAHQHGG